jgi:hypothetical protein
MFVVCAVGWAVSVRCTDCFLLACLLDCATVNKRYTVQIHVEIQGAVKRRAGPALSIEQIVIDSVNVRFARYFTIIRSPLASFLFRLPIDRSRDQIDESLHLVTSISGMR